MDGASIVPPSKSRPHHGITTNTLWLTDCLAPSNTKPTIHPSIPP